MHFFYLYESKLIPPIFIILTHNAHQPLAFDPSNGKKNTMVVFKIVIFSISIVYNLNYINYFI